MSPFIDQFPDVAGKEMLVLHIQEPNLPMPPGEYAFFECFCINPDCDCRRTVLQVRSPQFPGRLLATINYGWESEAFYTRWMHGDKKAGREITSAVLDLLNPQSDLADSLLDGFRDYVSRDSFYPQQLQRHYDMFKSTQTTAIAPPAGAPPASNMTPAEIIRQLQRIPDRADFAPYRAALLAAAVQREAITPELIAAIDRVSADPAHYLRDVEDCLHLFAVYLLAQFREHRALDAIVRLFSLPADQALDLVGEMITEVGAAILASVAGSDHAPLLRLVLDESASEFVRAQAIDGLLVQAVWGKRPREAVIGDLRGLFSTLPKPGNAYVWSSMACAVADFNAPELIPETRRVFDEGLVDESVIGPEEIDPAILGLAIGQAHYQFFCERNAPIDAVAEASGWVCFDQREEQADDWNAPDLGVEDAPHPASLEYVAQKPFIAPPKPGRNDPCLCGSGKKYKKCCGK